MSTTEIKSLPAYREEPVTDLEFGFLGSVRSLTLREGDSCDYVSDDGPPRFVIRLRSDIVRWDAKGREVSRLKQHEDFEVYQQQLQWKRTTQSTLRWPVERPVTAAADPAYPSPEEATPVLSGDQS